MQSLKTRINLGLLVAALVIFGAVMAYAAWAVPQITERQLITRLAHDSDSLIAGLVPVDGNDWRLSTDRMPLVYEQPFSGHYFVIRSDNISLRSQSLWDQSLPGKRLALGERRTLRLTGPRGQELLALYSAVEKRGDRFQLIVAEDVGPIEADIRQFQWVLAGGVLAGLVVFLLVQRWWLNRGFGQLSRVRDELTHLDQGTIERIPSTELYSEIEPLVEEINRLMGLMHERTERSRHLLGNLAHALKAPLTLLFQALDDPAFRDHPRLRAELRDQAGQIRETIDRQLKRARLASPGAPGHSTAVAPVVDALFDAMARIHRDRPVSARSDIPDGTVFRGDPEDLTELLGVLLDNAFKWASSAVRVTADSEAGLTITVEDDGPGCAEEQLERILERGRRLDETRPGSGLGLAIARDIVTHYGGDLTLENGGESGGMRARVRFR